MKATGIVRRVDDLGRIVIPKEIRRTLRIREGEPLEIFTDSDGAVIFKKYSPVGEFASSSAQYADAMNKAGGIAVAVCDKDSVIAVSGVPRREYIEKPISTGLSALLDKRQSYYADERGDRISLTDEVESHRISCLSPIITDGSVVGAMMSLRTSDTPSGSDAEKQLISAGALFLSKQLEI